METEYKLSSALNSQLKISGLTDTLSILNGVKFFADAAGFLIDSQDIPTGDGANRSDAYYDNIDDYLSKKGATLRVRKKLPNPKYCEVTLKIDISKDEKTGELKREEISELVDINNISPESMFGSSVFIEAKSRLGIDGRLSLIAEVFTRRSRLKLKYSDGLIVSLCFDRYYFARGEFYSEYFFEIEAEIIEKPNESVEGINALLKILEGIKVAFNFVPKPISKIDQAKSWFRSYSDASQNLHFIGFDIVGFTNLCSKDQLTVIQRINKATKEIINRINIDKSDLSSVITTGDGIVIGFKSFQSSLLKLAVDLLRQVSDKEDYFLGVRIRIAIHYGMVFKFSDVSEGISLTGNGINDLFRLLDFPEGSQIFVSSDAHKKFIFLSPSENKNMHGPEYRESKHGQVIEYYNYYSEREFGRPL